MQGTCSVTGCNLPQRCRNLCHRHHLKLLKYGDPNVSHCRHSKVDSLEYRFWSNIEKTDGCWVWIAACTGSGYGAIKVKGKQRGAHQVSYEIHYGPIPSGKGVLHKCDIRRCVRPDHLFLGTTADNMHDKVSKQRQAYGSRNGQSKLIENTVAIIKQQLRDGISNVVIAKQHNVTPGAIWNIATGITWKHIP